MRNNFIVLVFLISLFGCETSVNTVEDNIPPADATISLVLRQGYINTVYLGLLGRYPTTSENQTALGVLDQNNCDTTDRKEMIDAILADPEYLAYQYSIDYNVVLGFVDEGTVVDYAPYYLNLLIQDSTNVPLQAEAIVELEYLNRFIASRNLFKTGQITMQEAHKRMCSNIVFYWHIQTKSNWGNACFPYFLFRDATENEKYIPNDMMSGFERTLFNKTGDSFENLVDIFFESQEYIEGQVRTQFKRVLRREPSLEELYAFQIEFKKDLDIKKMHTRIMLLPELITP